MISKSICLTNCPTMIFNQNADYEFSTRVPISLWLCHTGLLSHFPNTAYLEIFAKRHQMNEEFASFPSGDCTGWNSLTSYLSINASHHHWAVQSSSCLLCLVWNSPSVFWDSTLNMVQQDVELGLLLFLWFVWRHSTRAWAWESCKHSQCSLDSN